jgi:cytochrome c-type biogenesis protein CcmF
MYERDFSKIVASNPSTKHYWNYDIFTHVSSLPKAELDPEFAKQQEDSLKFEKYEVAVGDTIFTSKHYLVVESIAKQPQHPDYHAEKGDLAFGLKLRAHSLDDTASYTAEPMLYLRMGKGGFTLPAVVNPLQMKIRLTEASMEKMLKLEEALQYTNFGVKEGGEFEYKGYKIRFTGAEREVKHPAYVPEPGDIAVAAVLEITPPAFANATAGKPAIPTSGTGLPSVAATATPVYLIRSNQTYSLKDEAPQFGLHFRFDNIDPKAGVLTIGVAQASSEQRRIPMEIAENITRSDYIVLEAILFPGINLVWIGSIMMMTGLGIALWRRLTTSV